MGKLLHMHKLGLILTLFIASCSIKIVDGVALAPTHEIWNDLVKSHVDNEGNVNYSGFIQDSALFNEYLELLSNAPPHKTKWSSNEQVAYWINAYNAFTIKLIIDHYPLNSIKDIKNGIAFVNSVWDIKFIRIGSQTLNLNNIEHGILRKEYEEPRIHFAVNCASKSCPKLLNEAYRAETLEQQLTQQARTFIGDPKKNKIKKDHVRLSKIFRWFNGDFTKRQSLIEFLNKYTDIEISRNAKIEYLDYDWTLNDK